MRTYIKNLTDNLIGKNRFDLLASRPININDPARLLTHIKDELEIDDVQKMNPETLGTIMCNLEIGDIWAGKEEIFGHIHFGGDPNDFFREQVALFLAYVIRDRLDPSNERDTVPYKRFQAGQMNRRIRIT